MKKQILLFSLLATILPIAGWCAEGDTFSATYNGVSLTYTILSESEKTCETGTQSSLASGATVTIPSTINGYKVIGIGYRSFRQKALKSISIPSSVISIGTEAFEGCSSLSSVTMSNGVQTIGWQAFKDCTLLTTVSIPGSVKDIGGESFRDCTKLTSVTIDYGVENIASKAFNGCSSLSSISFPSTIVSMSNDAVYGTLWYTNLPDGLTYIGKIAFKYKGTITGSLTIKSGTLSIADYAFQGTKMTSVSLPNSLTSIGNYSFSGCTELSSLNLPAAITSLGDYAFEKCTGLKTFSIPSNVTIGKYLLSGCTGLTSVTFANGITTISDGILSGCTGIKDIVLPNSVMSIGNRSFMSCSNLEAISIPNNVKYFSEASFISCSKLRAINIPQGVASLPQMVFEGCSSLESVTIPESVTTIGIRAFYGCSSLTEITIPGSVKNMETWDNCWAFSNCGNLRTITLNEGCVLGANTFSSCYNVEKVITWNNTPIEAHKSFTSFAYNATLYVPQGCIDAYKDAYDWKDFKEIKEIQENINISSNGIATYCSTRDLDFTDVTGLKAYIVSGFSPSTGKLTLTLVTKVPAGEGLLLKGVEGNYEVPYTTTDMYYSNLLMGVTTTTNISPTDGDQTNFILANGSHGIGFYTISETGPLAAGKAYLHLPTSAISALARCFIFDFDNEEATGIVELETETANANEYFNLQGRHVLRPSNGIYIVNGKKVFIK